MRFVLPLLITAVAACSPAENGPPTGSFAGTGRDRLCLAKAGEGWRGGIITFGGRDANCAAAGRIEKAGKGWVLVPRGEGDCRIGLTVAGDGFAVTTVPAACAYYCGGDASLAGKRFGKGTGPVTDFAGDPLC